MAAAILGGCAAVPVGELEGEADRLRDAAMKAFEHGDRKTALELNRRALAVTAHLPATSWRTVENYDDAGLYHYGVADWEQSARHQAIAVLLACGTKENAEAFPAYVQRLGWAFAKYRPGQDFRPIAQNPLRLLQDHTLAVGDNADLRRRFYVRYAAPNASRSSRPWYVFMPKSTAALECAS
jgi:hypothetical protein